MKKILFAVVALVAMSFASCNNAQTCGSAAVNDSDSIVTVDSVDSVALDSAAFDSTSVCCD